MLGDGMRALVELLKFLRLPRSGDRLGGKLSRAVGEFKWDARFFGKVQKILRP
jgi:hypothetical protein